MVLFILNDTYFKSLSSVNLLSNVNPRCFYDDAWETLHYSTVNGNDKASVKVQEIMEIY